MKDMIEGKQAGERRPLYRLLKSNEVSFCRRATPSERIFHACVNKLCFRLQGPYLIDLHTILPATETPNAAAAAATAHRKAHTSQKRRP